MKKIMNASEETADGHLWFQVADESIAATEKQCIMLDELEADYGPQHTFSLGEYEDEDPYIEWKKVYWRNES